MTATYFSTQFGQFLAYFNAFWDHFGIRGAPAVAQTTPGAPRGHPGHPQDAREASQGSQGVILGVPGPLPRLHFGVHFEVISVSFFVIFFELFFSAFRFQFWLRFGAILMYFLG